MYTYVCMYACTVQYPVQPFRNPKRSPYVPFLAAPKAEDAKLQRRELQERETLMQAASRKWRQKWDEKWGLTWFNHKEIGFI